MIRNILCDDSNPTVALHGQYPDVVDYEPTKQFNDYYPYGLRDQKKQIRIKKTKSRDQKKTNKDQKNK